MLDKLKLDLVPESLGVFSETEHDRSIVYRPSVHISFCGGQCTLLLKVSSLNCL